MDLTGMIESLHAELDSVDHAIQSMERLAVSASEWAASPNEQARLRKTKVRPSKKTLSNKAT